MARRHISGAVVAGFALVVAGVTVAPPAAAVSPTATAVSSIVVASVPQTKPRTKTKKPHRSHKSHQVNRGQLKKQPAQRPVTRTPTQSVKPATAAPKTAAASRTPHVRSAPQAAASPATPKQQVGPPQAQRRPPGVFRQVAGAVDHAVQAVVTIFGWNLLALFPMAGIALLISRRIRSAGLSAARRRFPL